MSQILIITSSTQPLKNPDIIPNTLPINIVIAIVYNETKIVVLAPYIILDNIHLPNWSVPRGYAADIAANLLVTSISAGSCGAKTGAPIATITKAAITIIQNTAILSENNRFNTDISLLLSHSRVNSHRENIY